MLTVVGRAPFIIGALKSIAAHGSKKHAIFREQKEEVLPIGNNNKNEDIYLQLDHPKSNLPAGSQNFSLYKPEQSLTQLE